MKPCGVPWPICPDCLGEPLDSSGGFSRCPRCRRRWRDASRDPCPDAATATVRDTAGSAGALCISHAVRAAAQIVGATVEGLSAAELAIAAELPARDQETAAMRAHDHAQGVAELEGKLAPASPERRAEIDDFNRGLHSVWRAYGGKPTDDKEKP